MNQSNQASDSSKNPKISDSKLEQIVEVSSQGNPPQIVRVIQSDLVQPSQDTSLVIVHVNNYYGSECVCFDSILHLLEERIASIVYEHASHDEAFLEKYLGTPFNRGQRYSAYDGLGIHYCMVDNETDPGNYRIDPITGRRFIMVGGGLGNCHKKATETLVDQLYENNPDKVSEIHLPADIVYSPTEGYEGGDRWLEGVIKNDISGLRAYSEVFGDRSYLMSVDKRIVDSNVSFEEPTIHLAVWSNLGKMMDYVKKKERLKIISNRKR